MILSGLVRALAQLKLGPWGAMFPVSTEPKTLGAVVSREIGRAAVVCVAIDAGSSVCIHLASKNTAKAMKAQRPKELPDGC
jgi:hypothetical protein